MCNHAWIPEFERSLLALAASLAFYPLAEIWALLAAEISAKTVTLML